MVPDEEESRKQGGSAPFDRKALTDALNQHPVRLAVLFGSHAKRTVHTDSDVDIAVEFEDNADPVEAYLPLVADLSSATDGVPVDVGVLSDLDPQIGVSMCRNGVLLVGEQDRFDHHCQQFREQAQNDDRKSPRERLHEHVETARQAVGHDA